MGDIGIEVAGDGARGICQLPCIYFQFQHVYEIQFLLVQYEDGSYLMLIDVGDTTIQLHVACQQVEQVLHGYGETGCDASILMMAQRQRMLVVGDTVHQQVDHRLQGIAPVVEGNPGIILLDDVEVRT